MGTYPCCRLPQNLYRTYLLKIHLNRLRKKYAELVAEGDGFEDDPDAYEAENIFFVPPEARWSEIAKAAHTPEIGTILDKAMIAIEADNKSLKGVLPKNYANPELDKRVLGNVVDVFTNMDMSDTEASKDLLGRTYEYCIAQFASYEGVKGGEFYTTASVVKTIVNIRKYLKAFRRKTRLRPMLRFGRNVRSVRKVHSGARGKQKQHLGLWTGSQCRHLENGQNEHGNPRNRRKLWRPSRRYLFQRPAFNSEVRLYHGKSALQLKQLGGAG